MITTYHRPQTLDEALTLLSQPNALPLGGGTLLAHSTANGSVVDLQALGLNRIHKKGKDSLTGAGQSLEIGATVTLQQLFESEHCPSALKTAIKLEVPLNLRNAATVAGDIVASDGGSSFATSLLALDAKITMIGASPSGTARSSAISIGEFLPLRPRGLITEITIPLNAKFAFEYVARTPSDKPIICAALAQWKGKRTRLALGGWGRSPSLAMDGIESEGLDSAARNACHEAMDEWASAEYRMDVAATLAKRCLETMA